MMITSVRYFSCLPSEPSPALSTLPSVMLLPIVKDKPLSWTLHSPKATKTLATNEPQSSLKTLTLEMFPFFYLHMLFVADVRLQVKSYDNKCKAFWKTTVIYVSFLLTFDVLFFMMTLIWKMITGSLIVIPYLTNKTENSKKVVIA